MGQLDAPDKDFCDHNAKNDNAILSLFLSRNQQVREEVGAILYDLKLLRELGILKKEEEAQYEKKLVLLVSKIRHNLRLLEEAQKYGRDYYIDQEGDIRYLIPPVSQRL